MELMMNNGMTELSNKEMYEVMGGVNQYQVAAWVVIAASFLLASTADWAIGKVLDWGYETVAGMMGW